MAPLVGEGESRERKQKVGCKGLTAKGRGWEVRKGEKQKDVSCLVVSVMIAIIIIISNSNQIYYVSSTLINASHV